MTDEDTSPDTVENPELQELPAIEFQSPGRFTVHNPAPMTPDIEQVEPAPFVLGAHSALERFEHSEHARAHALALLQQARHTLCIYSNDLEPWLYHHSSVQEACTAFLLASPRNRLRILVKDVSRAIREGHRLVTLSRRLSSNLHIRKLHPDYPAEDVTYLISDDRGLLMRPEPALPAGYALYQDPGRTRQRQSHFDQAWETSITDPDLRSFLL
ncbi:MAG: histone acetyltransferase HPA2 [Pseudomonas sp.]|uniref:DUF7931 domain-containing protein n=1 Tax=Pseudomonas sp. TaxID=306 RepID=UPI003D106FBE